MVRDAGVDGPSNASGEEHDARSKHSNRHERGPAAAVARPAGRPKRACGKSTTGRRRERLSAYCQGDVVAYVTCGLDSTSVWPRSHARSTGCSAAARRRPATSRPPTVRPAPVSMATDTPPGAVLARLVRGRRALLGPRFRGWLSVQAASSRRPSGRRAIRPSWGSWPARRVGDRSHDRAAAHRARCGSECPRGRRARQRRGRGDARARAGGLLAGPARGITPHHSVAADHRRDPIAQRAAELERLAATSRTRQARPPERARASK